MNRGKISNHFLLYFLMLMFLVVIVGCSSSSSSSNTPPPAGTTYTVTFDSQGATVAASPTSKSVVSPATTVGTLPTEPTKTGYTFAGWWTGTNGSGTEFIASTPVTADITVYAYWSTNPVYTVIYNSDGGTAVGIQHAISGGTTVLPAAPSKTGYIFGGWFTAVDGGGTQFTANTPVTANITVYAKWNSYSYTIKFDSQGATVAANPTIKAVVSPATTVVTLPTAPTRMGYTFGGWYTGTNGTGTQFIASTTVTADITVYAYWSANPVYTVTYDSQGGTAVGAQQVTLPATTVGTLPTAPTKTGCTFGGWYTGTNGTGTAFTASTTVTADITVYAKWTASTGTSTASGTYTWNSGTSVLTFYWISSNFPCIGPSLGTDTHIGVTITATTMTWPNDDMTWTRSSGTAGDPAGTWIATDTDTGDIYTIEVTATNSTSGTASMVGPTTVCGSGNYNPGADSTFNPDNGGGKYQVWMWYNDESHSASAVSVTGSGISGSEAFTYNSTYGSWDPTNGVNFGDTAPTLPLNYTFTITDTSTWTKTISISCFMQRYATNLSPTGTVTTATPTFTWTGISASDAKYQVQLYDNSYNQIWYSTKSFSTAVVYNGGTSLVSGNTYYYIVITTSKSTCSDGESFVQGSFIYQP